jgi:hypothetical protein
MTSNRTFSTCCIGNPPSSAVCAFYRWLEAVSSHDWNEAPLVVSPECQVGRLTCLRLFPFNNKSMQRCQDEGMSSDYLTWQQHGFDGHSQAHISGIVGAVNRCNNYIPLCALYSIRLNEDNCISLSQGDCLETLSCCVVVVGMSSFNSSLVQTSILSNLK